jgi:hypothetical protein
MTIHQPELESTSERRIGAVLAAAGAPLPRPGQRWRKTAGGAGAPRPTRCARQNTSRAGPARRNRGSDTLLDRLQDRHALHVVGRRKDVMTSCGRHKRRSAQDHSRFERISGRLERQTSVTPTWGTRAAVGGKPGGVGLLRTVKHSWCQQRGEQHRPGSAPGSRAPPTSTAASAPAPAGNFAVVPRGDHRAHYGTLHRFTAGPQYLTPPSCRRRSRRVVLNAFVPDLRLSTASSVLSYGKRASSRNSGAGERRTRTPVPRLRGLPCGFRLHA